MNLHLKKRSVLVLLVLHLLQSTRAFAHVPTDGQQGALVQIALLLDTSNSMDGLIAQAKSQLWKVVNELAYSERYGKRPVIEVALYEYGNNNLPASENYIRLVSPFTRDLDKISEKLFGLTTNGGEEYCGAVIDSALKQLPWTNERHAYKTIFIAGNEPFSQGPLAFQESSSHAWKHGIHINTIFCGNNNEGKNTGWADGARIGGGRYVSINSDALVVASQTPYDDDIVELGLKMNQTFIPLGSTGRQSQNRLYDMDKKAESHATEGSRVERSLFKGSKQYGAEWDAVSSVSQGNITVDKISKKDLPKEYESKSTAEISAIFKQKEKERSEIQKQLSDLQVKRQQYLAELNRSKPASPSTLDQAMQDTVRQQAAEKNFIFK